VIAAAALTVAACGGNDSSSVPCQAAPACGAVTVNIVPGGTACGTYGAACQTDQSTTCNKPIVSPDPTVTSRPKGPRTVGDVVTFDVPAGTAGFSIVSQAVGNVPPTVTYKGTVIPNIVVPDKVTAPNGDLIYDDFVAAGADPSNKLAFYATDSPSTGAFSIPNTTPMLGRAAKGLQTGNWSFKVNDFAFECVGDANCGATSSSTSQYDVSVVLRSGSVTDKGTLDIALYLVGVPAGLTSASAAADPGVQRMVQSLSKLYGGAGLCVGKVTVYDVPAWAQAAYGANMNVDDTTPCGKLNQMFTLSVPGDQLNFFLVAHMVAASQGGGTVVGIDGTIPGPSAYGGTIHSGAAVSSDSLETRLTSCGSSFSLSCGPDEVAYIAAHEGGHWMGLYHTTEYDGESFDPLVDTSKCPCEQCALAADRANCNNPDPSKRTSVNVGQCTASSTCGGGDDLMFWILAGGSLGKLTCEQGAVMRSNVAVR
jgi:hypothetical protein